MNINLRRVSKLLTNNYFLSLTSLFVFAVVICARAVGFELQTFITLLLYSALTFQMLRAKYTGTGRLVGIFLLMAPFIFFLLPYHIVFFKGTLVSLPSSLAFPLGVLFGYLIYLSRVVYKALLIIILCTTAMFMFFWGYALWLNKLNFNSFFSLINEPVPSSLKFAGDDGSEFSPKDHADEITVLDFWDTGCGICFSKFPILQQKHDQYARTNKIKFYSVNLPLKRDTLGQGRAVFKALRYSVTALTSKNNTAVVACGVTSVPTVLVIYHNRIVYRGDIENLDRSLNAIL